MFRNIHINDLLLCKNLKHKQRYYCLISHKNSGKTLIACDHLLSYVIVMAIRMHTFLTFL